MRLRPSARMLIIDPADRILLFRTENSPMDPVSAVAAYWYVPGGGVEEGETFEEAARRELWEEVGVEDVGIGPCVWYREQILHFPSSGEALACERFFPVRVQNDAVNFANMIDIEATVLARHHWWPVDELRVCSDVVFPEEIADLLPPILAGEYPAEPIVIR